MKIQVKKTKHNFKQSPCHRQRGNTLVPVVIGLGIAAVATVGFLNQGSELTARNNANLAINEINSYLGIYNTFRSGGTNVESSIDNIPGLTDANSNSYGNTNGETATTITFVTDSSNDCTLLRNLLPAAANIDGVNTHACTDATLTLTME